MFKLYIKDFTSHKDRDGIDCEFCSDASNAYDWVTKEDAEIDGVHIECSNVTIHSSERTPHLCSGFTIEQRAPKEFVIFYEVPFLPIEATPEIGEDGSNAT